MSIFAGIRFLDLTRLLPGAYCSLLFADLGADVIKIEEPGMGDYARWLPPGFGKEASGAAFQMLNRNKKSLTLNLKHEDGKMVFRRLAAAADIVLESFRPGVMRRLGVGYEALSEINPRLIYCSITGYGQDGPYQNLAGHDINFLGHAGVLAITGARGGPPVPPGAQMADLGGGSLMAAFTIAAALHHRNLSGRGQMLDVSMTDGVVSWLSTHLGVFFATGRVPSRGEERLNGGLVCYGVYETKDGKYLTLGALEPKFWQAFCRVLGREDLVPHQYAAGEKRDKVEADLRQTFKTKTRDEWLAAFKGVDACVGPVLDFDEVREDPGLRERGLFQSVHHPTAGEIPQVAFPVKLSATPAAIERAAPELGEHTDNILNGLGYSSDEIAGFRARDVI